MIMDESIINSLPVYHETRFRTPSGFERECGLWVDRIGRSCSANTKMKRLRVLGRYAVVAVDEGQGQVLTRSYGHCHVDAGDVILLTPDEPEAHGPLGAWSSRWIVWGGQEADVFQPPDRPPVLRGASAAVRQAYREIEACLYAEDVASILLRKSILLQLMVELMRVQQSSTAYRGTKHRIEQVMDYIQHHLNSRMTVAELAGLCHLSEPHFRRLFTQHTGCSPMQYVTAQRISRAKELLGNGVTIKATAAQVGYADHLYFMRVFKQATGQTAGQFYNTAMPRE